MNYETAMDAAEVIGRVAGEKISEGLRPPLESIPPTFVCEASPHQRHEWRYELNRHLAIAATFYCIFCRTWR